MRETIEGVLHVIRTPKERRGAGPLERLVTYALEDEGIIQPEYYPPTYYVLSPQTVGERRTDNREWRNGEPFQFRFRGQPKALAHDLAGHTVTIRATVEPWHNELGGHLNRPRIVTIGEYVECPYHDDPYRSQESGSARIYCDSWLREMEVSDDS